MARPVTFLLTRLSLVRAAWLVLLLLGNLTMASAIMHRDTISASTLVGVGLLTFYANFGGLLLFIARDANYYLAGIVPPGARGGPP